MKICIPRWLAITLVVLIVLTGLVLCGFNRALEGEVFYPPKIIMANVQWLSINGRDVTNPVELERTVNEINRLYTLPFKPIFGLASDSQGTCQAISYQLKDDGNEQGARFVRFYGNVIETGRGHSGSYHAAHGESKSSLQTTYPCRPK